MRTTPRLICYLIAFCLLPVAAIADPPEDNKGPSEKTTYKTNPDGSLTVDTTTHLENGGVISVRTTVPARKVKKWLEERAKDGEEPSEMTAADVPFILIDTLKELSVHLPFYQFRETGSSTSAPPGGGLKSR